MNPLARVLCGLLALLIAACAQRPGTPGPTTADAAARLGDGYYLTGCAHCGEPLGARGEAIKTLQGQREVLFCRAECRESFERDRAAGLARLDAVMIEDQRPIYPTATSVVSGRPLGERPVDFIWYNRLVRVADERERAEFVRDPGPALERLDAAVIEYRTPYYTIDKCLIQGVPLPEGKALDVVVANRLFRVCCGQCAMRIRNNPRMHTAIVDYSWKEHGPASSRQPAGAGG